MNAISNLQMETKGNEAVFTRMFDAPRTLVFKAWTESKRLSRWWGPRGFECPVCQMDARPGGTYRIVMRAPDGTDYPLKGVFREIVEPERLVMTIDCSEHPEAWHDIIKPNRSKDERNPAGEMIWTVTFDESTGRTKLTIRTQFVSEEIRDAMIRTGMREGLGESLDRLEELTAKV